MRGRNLNTENSGQILDLLNFAHDPMGLDPPEQPLTSHHGWTAVLSLVLDFLSVAV